MQYSIGSGIIALQMRSSLKFLLLPLLLILIGYHSHLAVTFGEVATQWKLVLSHPLTAIKKTQTPGVAPDALSPEITEMLSLLTSNSVESYRISGIIAKWPAYGQRIEEVGFPIRQKKEAKTVLLFLAEQSQFSNCRIIDRRQLLALATCP